MRNEQCRTTQTCKNNCPVVERLYQIAKVQVGKPESTTEANMDRVKRDTGKLRCPPGAFDQAVVRIFGS